MTRHRFSQRTEQKLTALIQRVDRTIEECHRFEDMTAHRTDWAERERKSEVRGRKSEEVDDGS